MKAMGWLGRLPGLAAMYLAVTTAPCLLAGPSAKKIEALESKPATRQYVIFVLTTESRIPKRYIVRYNGSKLTTVQPLSMYFNNNRLQLYDADLRISQHP